MPLEYRSPSSAGHANANRALRGETGIGDSGKLVAATTALKPIPTSRVVGAGPANVPPANAGSQRSRQPSRRDLLFVRDITGPGSCRELCSELDDEIFRHLQRSPYAAYLIVASSETFLGRVSDAVRGVPLMPSEIGGPIVNVLLS